MTDTDQPTDKETKVDPPTEGTERGGPASPTQLLVLFALIVVGSLGALFLVLLFTGQQAIASSTQIVAALATLFIIVATLGGTYLGIKTSSEATREIQRAADATDVYAQQLADTKPENILVVAAAHSGLR